MEYDKELLNKITGMGMLGYEADKIINILDIEDAKQFKVDFANVNSEVYKSYKKGVDKSDYMIDLKLFELAKTGDKKAIEMFEKRKEGQKKPGSSHRLFT